MREATTGQGTEKRLRAACAAFAALALILTVIPFGLSARALEPDGLLKEKMWLEAEPFTVIRLKDQSNCSVEEAKIFVCFDERNSVTYLGCRITHRKPAAESSSDEPGAEQTALSGVAVKVENTDFLTFSLDHSDTLNNGDYQIQGAASSLSETCTTAEIVIAQKCGFGDPLSLQLRFYDADGVISNVYALAIPSPTPPTTPVVVTLGETTAAPSNTAKPTASRTQKETQSATQRTTQERTTAEKTTQEKTTKEKTTKEKTTKQKTTKVKTTKAPKTKTTKAAAAGKTNPAKTTQPPVDNDALLQEVLAEQTKTRTALYIGVGVLIVALFIVCSYAIRKKDE